MQRYVRPTNPTHPLPPYVLIAWLTNIRVYPPCTQIRQRVALIEETGGKKVTRFSITGYSLGGLLARCVIGALHAAKFFDTVEPVNFTTIATPHLGIPRYPSFFSAMVSYCSVLRKFDLLILLACFCRARKLGQGYLGGWACNSMLSTSPMVRIHVRFWRSWRIIVSTNALP